MPLRLIYIFTLVGLGPIFLVECCYLACLCYNKAMAYFDARSNALALEMAVVGTHLSGKTTFVNSFRNPELESYCDVTEPFGLGVIELDHTDIDMPEGSSSLTVPIVTIAEAATDYAKSKGNIALLGDEYTFESQRQIDLEAAFRPQMAHVIFSEAHRKLQSYGFTGRVANLGVILSDRERLDGKAYSSIRTPEEDDDTLGMKAPLREWFRQAIRSSLDCVFIASPSDVPFELDVSHTDNQQVRNDVQTKIEELYHNATGGLLLELSGTVENRRETLRSVVSLFVDYPLLVSLPITSLRE